MVSLSAPCELLISPLFYCLLDQSYGEYNGISLYFVVVNGSVVLCVLTVFVNCLVKQFAIFLGVDIIVLLNVMEVSSVGVGALMDRLCMVFQKMWVFPVCI